MKKVNKNQLQTRSMRFDNSKQDIEKRTVSAALSSEVLVNRSYGTEKLLHQKGAINLERAKDGLPLLFHHDPTKPIGRVDNIRLDSDGKLRGDMSFSNNSLAQEVWGDVRDGFLNGVSIGYTIQDFKESRTGIEATEWTLKEASITAVEADINAGLNRSDPENNINEGLPMKTKEQKDAEKAAIDGYKATEATRKADINTAFGEYQGGEFDALKTRALSDDKITVDQVRKDLLTIIGKNTAAHGAAFIAPGADENDKFNRAIEDSLIVRVGSCRDKKIISDVKNNEFSSWRMIDIARACLERNGILKRGMSQMDIIGEAMVMRAIHGVADFPNLLANVANSSIQMAYEEAEETWRLWARVGNLSDFKLTDRPNLSAFEDLPVVLDKADYTEGSFSDLKESMQLATYGRIFKLTRQAMINDNLDGLGRIPASMARAAARTVGTLAYNVLINNAAMNQDAEAVFSAAHTNDNDDPGSVGVTNAQIATGKLAMSKQTDPSGNATLGIKPSFLLLPTSMADNGRVVMNAEYEPGTAPGNLQPNPHKGLMQVVEEHRLEAETDKPWFMVASKAAAETVEVAFLDGQDSPTLEQDDPFTYDGVTFKVRIDAAAQAIDFRGMQRFSNLTP